MTGPGPLLRARRLRAARGVVVARDVSRTPLLRMSTHSSTLLTPVGDQVAWLCLPGLLLVAAAAFLVTRPT